MMPRPRDAQLCPAPPLPTALHHGVVTLRSLFKSTTGFLSLHSEVLRMSSSGWFELTDMPRRPR